MSARLTQDEIREICRMFEGGSCAGEIAKKFGRGTDTIRNYLRKYGYIGQDNWKLENYAKDEYKRLCILDARAKYGNEYDPKILYQYKSFYDIDENIKNKCYTVAQKKLAEYYTNKRNQLFAGEIKKDSCCSESFTSEEKDFIIKLLSKIVTVDEKTEKIINQIIEKLK